MGGPVLREHCNSLRWVAPFCALTVGGPVPRSEAIRTDGRHLEASGSCWADGSEAATTRNRVATCRSRFPLGPPPRLVWARLRTLSIIKSATRGVEGISINAIGCCIYCE